MQRQQRLLNQRTLNNFRAAGLVAGRGLPVCPDSVRAALTELGLNLGDRGNQWIGDCLGNHGLCLHKYKQGVKTCYDWPSGGLTKARIEASYRIPEGFDWGDVEWLAPPARPATQAPAAASAEPAQPIGSAPPSQIGSRGPSQIAQPEGGTGGSSTASGAGGSGTAPSEPGGGPAPLESCPDGAGTAASADLGPNRSSRSARLARRSRASPRARSRLQTAASGPPEVVAGPTHTPGQGDWRFEFNPVANPAQLSQRPEHLGNRAEHAQAVVFWAASRAAAHPGESRMRAELATALDRFVEAVADWIAAYESSLSLGGDYSLSAGPDLLASGEPDWLGGGKQDWLDFAQAWASAASAAQAWVHSAEAATDQIGTDLLTLGFRLRELGMLVTLMGMKTRGAGRSLPPHDPRTAQEFTKGTIRLAQAVTKGVIQLAQAIGARLELSRTR